MLDDLGLLVVAFAMPPIIRMVAKAGLFTAASGVLDEAVGDVADELAGDLAQARGVPRGGF